MTRMWQKTAVLRICRIFLPETEIFFFFGSDGYYLTLEEDKTRGFLPVLWFRQFRNFFVDPDPELLFRIRIQANMKRRKKQINTGSRFINTQRYNCRVLG